MPKPWERQRHWRETSLQFFYFATYRDMGPRRSIEKVSREVGKKAGYLDVLSSRFKWVDRARAWDDEADRKDRERDEVERQAARRRDSEERRNTAKLMRTIAEEAIRARFPSDPAKRKAALSELGPSDIAKWVAEAVKIERLETGEATDRVEQRVIGRVVDGIIDLALEYVSDEAREAFLAAVEQRFGMGQT
jgi:hypothetical protein